MSASQSQDLGHPWVRDELVIQLQELAEHDPRPIWRRDASRGLASGFDEVIHFFFDDHDFDATALGIVFVNADEVKAVEVVKAALDQVLAACPHGQDDDYVGLAIWSQVTRAAGAP